MSDFSKFAADLTSLYWWITVVIVGVTVNLASSYLKDPIDRFISAWSENRLNKVKARNIKILEEGKIISSDPNLLAIEMHQEVISLLTATLLVAFAAVMFIINQYLIKSGKPNDLIQSILLLGLNAPPAAFVLFALRFLSKATEHRQKISAARAMSTPR